MNVGQRDLVMQVYCVQSLQLDRTSDLPDYLPQKLFITFSKVKLSLSLLQIVSLSEIHLVIVMFVVSIHALIALASSC